MISLLRHKPASPIGVDLGTQSLKLLQFDAQREQLVAAMRWETFEAGTTEAGASLSESLTQAYRARPFRGRDAVICLRAPDLFVQNIRVPKVSPAQMDEAVYDEAQSRLPFPIEEAEIRYIAAADVRQGDEVRREVILLACHQPVLDRTLKTIEEAGLRPVAVDIEPAALLRGYCRSFRRDADQELTLMFVNVGGAHTVVVIARGSDLLFIKYLDIGGYQLDEAVASHLDMSIGDAAGLRRSLGERRSEERDPEIAATIKEATRGLLDRLGQELSLCARYHSVAFRGQPIDRVIIGGGEASDHLVTAIDERVERPCELGNPLRGFQEADAPGRASQWDVAAGLAMREVQT